MYFNWTEQSLFPAERNALLREIEKDISITLVSEEQAEEKIKAFDEWTYETTNPTEGQLKAHQFIYSGKEIQQGLQNMLGQIITQRR